MERRGPGSSGCRQVEHEANCLGLTHEAALQAQLLRFSGRFVDSPLGSAPAAPACSPATAGRRSPSAANRRCSSAVRWLRRLRRDSGGSRGCRWGLTRGWSTVRPRRCSLAQPAARLVGLSAAVRPESPGGVRARVVRAHPAGARGGRRRPHRRSASGDPRPRRPAPGDVPVVDGIPRVFEVADAQWAPEPKVLGAAWVAGVPQPASAGDRLRRLPPAASLGWSDRTGLRVARAGVTRSGS